MSNEENAVFESKIDWQPLDLVIRGWIALGGFENDLAQYQKIQEMYSLK